MTLQPNNTSNIAYIMFNYIYTFDNKFYVLTKNLQSQAHYVEVLKTIEATINLDEKTQHFTSNSWILRHSHTPKHTVYGRTSLIGDSFY